MRPQFDHSEVLCQSSAALVPKQPSICTEEFPAGYFFFLAPSLLGKRKKTAWTIYT